MNGNGFRVPKKVKTAKLAGQLEKRVDSLERVLQSLVNTFFGQLQQLRKEIVTARANIDLIEFRSLATLEELIARGVFTAEEHATRAEALRISNFNEISEQDNQEKFLRSVDEPAADGYFIVAQMEAYDEAGNKIDELSPLRSKIKLGAAESFRPVEEQILGMKPQETKEFVVTMPDTFPVYGKQNVRYKVYLLQVLVEEKQEETLREPQV